ncbi:MAG: 1,4-alpha-glucan branching protein GlgB [Burkholderiaceae bacterium]
MAEHLPYDAGTFGDVSASSIMACMRGRWPDPFALLGVHARDAVTIVRTFQPGAARVDVLAPGAPQDGSAEPIASLRDVNDDGLFVGPVPASVADQHYVLCIAWPDAAGREVLQYTEDPYAFAPLLGELDLHLLGEGTHLELGRCLGAQVLTIDGVTGTRFAVWAPNAWRVSVVGGFNNYDGRRHPMRLRGQSGVWELFVPRVGAGAVYQYELVGADGSLLPLKADPVARATELAPRTGSVVAEPSPFRWNDMAWMQARAAQQSLGRPMSIYEVHAGSWMRVMEDGARNLHWEELAEKLIPYAVDMGFTHLEFLPIMEHPFGGSWGYQPLGQFAPSARFGSPHDFARFVDRCHEAGLGVILDWVPAHFPADTHGLARFDGTALYEHQDPREGFHQDWNTLIYNLGRNEVCGFLIASALEWLEHYHVDGLRVDAVASMLYRDYSRKHNEWIPNIYGGRENLEAVAFLRKLNDVVAARCPGAMMIAEESTAWPGVSAPVSEGGLGFTYKWNMGWMHDTLHYMAYDPLYRRHHHHELTFGLVYAFSEKFVLPISHDEVVHGKGSLINKMPGAGASQKLANLRAYLAFMWTHPGKKLLFMGCELAQVREWNHDASVEWDLLDDPQHRGVQRLVRDLNRAYVSEPALHRKDTDPQGFAWVIGDDSSNSVFAYLRRGDADNAAVLVICNLVPVLHAAYRIGVPRGADGSAGRWVEVLSTDDTIYGGATAGAANPYILPQACASHGFSESVALALPPLATIILKEIR